MSEQIYYLEFTADNDLILTGTPSEKENGLFKNSSGPVDIRVNKGWKVKILVGNSMKNWKFYNHNRPSGVGRGTPIYIRYGKNKFKNIKGITSGGRSGVEFKYVGKNHTDGGKKSYKYSLFIENYAGPNPTKIEIDPVITNDGGGLGN